MTGRPVLGYALTAGGVAVAFGGVVVAAVANIPGDRGDVSRSWEAPDGWLSWLAIGLAVAWLLWAWTARLGTSVAMAVACAAGLVLVLVRMPDRGIDLSFPLTALGLALSLLGALAVVAGNLPRLVGDRDLVKWRTRWVVRVASVAFAALLAVGLAIGLVPWWVVAANTEASTAAGSGPADWRSTLDGSVAWRASGLPNPANAHYVGTAGGIAVLDERGVRVLDAASGEQRWSFRRWDVTGTASGRPARSFAVSEDGRWLAMTYRVDAPRRRFVDDRRDRDRAWVFAAVSGRVRADVPVPEDSELLAVTGQRILVSVPGGDDQPEDGRLLAPVGLDGEVAWRYRPGGGCAPAQISTVDDDPLALVRCGQTQSLVRLDGATGAVRWTWRAGQFGGDPAHAGHQERHQDAVLAVAGGTAVVDVRVHYYSRGSGGAGEVTAAEAWHNLVGVRLADGGQAWERRDQHSGDLPALRRAGAVGVLHAAGGTVVLAEQNRSGAGRAARDSIALRGFAAATGQPAWSVDLPDSQFSEAFRNDSVAVLPDGRLVVTYLDRGRTGTPDFCAVVAWDAATGARQADVRLRRSAPDAIGNQCTEAFPVEVDDGVALWVPQRGLLMLR